MRVMRRLFALAFPLALAALAARPAAGLDVETVVRRAAERQRETERSRVTLALDETEVTTDFLADGRRRSADRRLYAAVLEGIAVVSRDLRSVDGRAATDEERRKVRDEDSRRRRARAARAGSPDDDLKSGRLDLLDMLSRFTFRFEREEVVDGRPCWVIAFEPKAVRASRTVRDRVLDAFTGLAWIDTVDLQASRIEGRLSEPVRVAGGLALSLQRVEILYEARPVLPGVWAPCLEVLRVEARAALVIPFRREFRLEFAGHRPAGTRGLSAG